MFEVGRTACVECGRGVDAADQAWDEVIGELVESNPLPAVEFGWVKLDACLVVG